MIHSKLHNRWAVGISMLMAVAGNAFGQDRDTKVRDDRATFKTTDAWVYNDLDSAIAQAAQSKKPILAVLRCVP